MEVGRTDAAPACPASPCLAVSRTTGYQIKVADERGSFVVPEDGKIVAWTIALGKPTTEQIAFFDKGLGGPASARITVLRPGKTLYSRVVTPESDPAAAPATSVRRCSSRSVARSTSRRDMSSR